MNVKGTHKATLRIGSVQYVSEGHNTQMDAIMAVYRNAFENGHWKPRQPRQLRHRWWQFWLPIDHGEIEKRFINMMSR